MQVTEREHVNNPVPREVSCTVCSHPQRESIDKLLAAGTISRRTIANQFGISDGAVQRHKTNHFGRQVARAVAKREAKQADVFMERHEHLYREALQYIEDAKGAVKMQKVTAEVETDDGIKLQDRYERFRDVSAMAPAIGAATALQRVLGDATARFSSQAAATVHNHLSVIMPRAVEQQPALCDKVDSLTLDIATVSATSSPLGDQPALGDVIEVAAIEPGEPPKE